jgi:hypothetical protein
MPNSRGRKKKSSGYNDGRAGDRSSRSPERGLASHRRWARAIKWTIGAAITLFGLVAGVVGVWGPPWPADPEIHPHDTVDGSSLVLPFIVKDRSALFDIPNVTFDVELIWLKDQAFISGIYSVTAGGPPLNYPCDAEDLLQMRADGTLSMYGASTIIQSAKRVNFHPPWHVVSAGAKIPQQRPGIPVGPE